MNMLFTSVIFTLAGLVASPSAGNELGDKVDNFTLINTVDKEMVSLSDYKDEKGVIVIFTCNHCPYSKAYEQRIMDLDKKFAGKGYPVVAISPNDPEKEPDDSPKNMRALALEKGYTFPYLFDETQEVARKFGATRTPHVFLLKNTGDAFRLAYIGAIDDNTNEPENVQVRFVEDAIRALEKGEKPDPALTKAIGCTIKWKE
jgi:peroxiredoxin